MSSKNEPLFPSNQELCANPADLINMSKSGCYKWWATEKRLAEFLEQLDKTKFEEVNTIETDSSNKWYCIYVGKADVIGNRLVNHAKSDFYKSTLRQSIASLIKDFKNFKSKQKIEDAVDEILKDLRVTFIQVEESKVKNKEEKLINGEYLRLLNIDKNTHRQAEKIMPILKRKRKELREKFPKEDA